MQYSTKQNDSKKTEQKMKPSHIQTRQCKKGHATPQADIIVRPDGTTPTTTTPTPTTKEAIAAANLR